MTGFENYSRQIERERERGRKQDGGSFLTCHRLGLSVVCSSALG
jgi:hypothetical protein